MSRRSSGLAHDHDGAGAAVVVGASRPWRTATTGAASEVRGNPK
jgi:hypothetical protein